MKSVIVAALMMSAMALSAAAAGTYDYCTAGARILLDRTVAMQDDLTSYRGVNCETDPKVNIIFDASVAPNGFGITGTYSDGTIGSGGSLQIVGPTGDKAALTAPILIRIERNIFATDAVLFVKGSFPTSSLISISNNQFDVGTRHSVLIPINTNFISAITFGDYDSDMLLYTNAQVTVYENTIKVEDRSGDSQPFETYGIYTSSNVYMSNDAGMLIQRNNITGSTLQNTLKAVGVYFPRYVFVMGNSTLVQIQGNRMDLVNGVVFQSPSIALSGEYAFNADFSQNIGTVSPVHSLTYAAIIGPVNLTSTATVEVADNVIVNRNSDTITLSTRMIVNGPAHVRGQAGFYIWFNTMNTQGGSPQFSFGGPIQSEQEGKVWFVGNQMERQENLVLGLAPIYVYSLSLRDSSNVAFSQNVFGSPNPNNKPLLVTISSATDGPVWERSENATFDVCHNTWYGSELASTDEVKNLMNPVLRPLVTDLSQCPAIITTTTSTQPPTTTTATEPLGNINDDSAAPAVAKAAAVAALLGALLALFAF